MKRWLTFVLFLITVTASFYRCCNEDCCNDASVAKTTDRSHRPEGNCSPFITCGTCPGFTQMASTVDLPSVPKEKPVHHSRIISLTLSTYTASLLQPPRLA